MSSSSDDIGGLERRLPRLLADGLQAVLDDSASERWTLERLSQVATVYLAIEGMLGTSDDVDDFLRRLPQRLAAGLKAVLDDMANEPWTLERLSQVAIVSKAIRGA